MKAGKVRVHSKCQFEKCGRPIKWGRPEKVDGRVLHETVMIGETKWHRECWNEFISELRERFGSWNGFVGKLREEYRVQVRN